MNHYIAYHSSPLMGHPYTPDTQFKFLSKKPERVLRGALGGWVWVILGERNGTATRYQLMGVYSPSHVESETEGFLVTGPGIPFEPPIELNERPWFQELLEEQANFSLGFNATHRAIVTEELERILASAAALSLRSDQRDVATFAAREDPTAHAQLQAWRRTHQDGFLLNCRSKANGLLHRAICPHLGDFDWAGDHDLTRQRKACSVSIPLLLGWARAEGISDVTSCSDCKPAQDDEALVEHAVTMLEAGTFAVTEAADARQWMFASIVRRQGQPAFRKTLLAAYSGKCAITGCGVDAVLEAAHIVPYQGIWTNHPQNGLLLRADIHTLFDLGLIAVDERVMAVMISEQIQASPYGAIAGCILTLPKDLALQPSALALAQHRKRSGLAPASEESEAANVV